ncbi:MAG: DUF3892 domain-containing protein [Symploca sp. SIO1A3]|nr:DUF3892 domain-containing protein [Symploca sp. SIO2C1]NER51708.1 DUF3892 domain-containing protein [Symploca sp. SIO1A3]
MSNKRKVVDARQGDDGNISHIKLEGNQNFTRIERAIEMAEKGKLENVHIVNQQDGSQYLRTNPDGEIQNNLDTMAQE